MYIYVHTYNKPNSVYIYLYTKPIEKIEKEHIVRWEEVNDKIIQFHEHVSDMYVYDINST